MAGLAIGVTGIMYVIVNRRSHHFKIRKTWSSLSCEIFMFFILSSSWLLVEHLLGQIVQQACLLQGLIDQFPSFWIDTDTSKLINHSFEWKQATVVLEYFIGEVPLATDERSQAWH